MQPRVDRSAWALLAAVAYALLPIDAMPDVVPLAGLVDDLGVAGVALGLVGWWRRGGTWRDLLPLVAALAYDLVPVDLVPDAIPGVGEVDDLVATALAVGLWWWRRRAGDTGAGQG
ncbi:MAG TPA: DUF1232 domain-containing protein [Myxococcota bacterium]|nr:DUF1232 domain-containing protein [Myxococcota bacterium]